MILSTKDTKDAKDAKDTKDAKGHKRAQKGTKGLKKGIHLDNVSCKSYILLAITSEMLKTGNEEWPIE